MIDRGCPQHFSRARKATFRGHGCFAGGTKNRMPPPPPRRGGNPVGDLLLISWE